jgi:hypothetical protein
MTLLFTLLLLVSGVGHSDWQSRTLPTTTAGSEIKGDVLYWKETSWWCEKCPGTKAST